MASQLSNHYKYQLLKAVEGHTFKLMLMETGFSFNIDTHSTYADVSANQLAIGSGYSGPVTLANVAASEDDTDNNGNLVADDVVITASGGAIGPTPGAIIFDDTSSDDSIVGYVDFGSEQTAADGAYIAIRTIKLSIT